MQKIRLGSDASLFGARALVMAVRAGQSISLLVWDYLLHPNLLLVTTLRVFGWSTVLSIPAIERTTPHDAWCPPPPKLHSNHPPTHQPIQQINNNNTNSQTPSFHPPKFEYEDKFPW